MNESRKRKQVLAPPQKDEAIWRRKFFFLNPSSFSCFMESTEERLNLMALKIGRLNEWIIEPIKLFTRDNRLKTILLLGFSPRAVKRGRSSSARQTRRRHRTRPARTFPTNKEPTPFLFCFFFVLLLLLSDVAASASGVGVAREAMAPTGRSARPRGGTEFYRVFFFFFIDFVAGVASERFFLEKFGSDWNRKWWRHFFYFRVDRPDRLHQFGITDHWTIRHSFEKKM